MTERIRVDADDLTLGELAEATDIAGDIKTAGDNFRNTAALAWVTKRRTDPTFTFEDALKLKMGDIEIVSADPEVPSDGNGVMPLPSLAPGI